MSAVDRSYYHKRFGTSIATVNVPASDLLRRIAHRHLGNTKPDTKPEPAPRATPNIKIEDQRVIDALVKVYQGANKQQVADELGVALGVLCRWFDGVNRSRLTLEAERIYRQSLRLSSMVSQH